MNRIFILLCCLISIASYSQRLEDIVLCYQSWHPVHANATPYYKDGLANNFIEQDRIVPLQKHHANLNGIEIAMRMEAASKSDSSRFRILGDFGLELQSRKFAYSHRYNKNGDLYLFDQEQTNRYLFLKTGIGVYTTIRQQLKVGMGIHANISIYHAFKEEVTLTNFTDSPRFQDTFPPNFRNTNTSGTYFLDEILLGINMSATYPIINFRGTQIRTHVEIAFYPNINALSSMVQQDALALSWGVSIAPKHKVKQD